MIESRGIYLMPYRKTNKGKRADSGCRNHGTCQYCTGNRTHASKRRAPLIENYGGNYAQPEMEKNNRAP
jgi:hypothetical protein